MAILLTGGAGFIGSHTAVACLNAGVEVVLADNFSNSSPKVLDRIEKITGKRPALYNVDVCDKQALRGIFAEQSITGVVHFAGLKAVGESVRLPLAYYRNNLDSALSVLEVMQEFGCKEFVFSSSATVYGDQPAPLTESADTGHCSNPYGWTKFMIEQILKDAAGAVLRGVEIEADAVLMAKNVDAIYSADPAKDPTAVRYSRLTYGEVLAKNLKATDITAMALAMDNDMTMVCFGLNEENSIVRVVRGEEIGTTVKNHF